MQKILKCVVSVSTIFMVVFSPFTSLTPTVSAADTGWYAPASYSGGSSWTTPNNAYTSNNQYATVSNNNKSVQYSNFTIPAITSGATINGIEVSLEGKTTGRQVAVALSYDNGSNWTTSVNSTNGGTESTINLGGSSGTWGRTWSVSDFTNSNFQVKLTSNNTSGTYSLDRLQVKVYYTAPAAPVVNPSLGGACGLDVALVLDNSASIESTGLTQMKNAFNGFVSALSVTPTQFSVTNFNTTATVLQAFSNSTSVIAAAINSVSLSSGYTNWQDGLVKAQSTFDPRVANPNLIILASDGQPNRYSNPAQGSGTGVDSNALASAITQANTIKASGTRIITLGIGSSVNATNMIAISSADAYYTAVNFSDLQTALQQIATDLCGGTITVTKMVGQTPTAGWNFTINATTKTTGPDGKANWDLNNGTYSITETAQTGYTLNSASCEGAANNGTFSGNSITGIQVTTANIVSCVFYNSVNPFCGDGAVNQTSEQCDDGNIVDGDGCSANCMNEEEDAVTIIAQKIVCNLEADLPNWGNGGADITATTAADYVAKSDGQCSLVSGWNFQWGQEGSGDPGRNFYGEAGGYTTFGPTDSNGAATAVISTITGSRLELREVLQNGYIPFTFDQGNQSNSNNVSAEFYCHDDVLNYDNFDYVNNPQLGSTYYCVAFNTLANNSPVCGNESIEAGEQCDDGNTVSGDGCSATCQLEQNPPEPICGNQAVESGEQCDDGNTVSGDGCSATCQLEQNPPEPICGNQAVESGEQCDDGNIVDGDGCSATCQTENIVCTSCGPSFVCGDGNVSFFTGEECDDGNAVSGDGCSASCKIETTPAPGGLVAGESTCSLESDIIVVMDVSGSMGYEFPSRLAQAKIAANSLLNYLGTNDQSGLVSFSWNATLNEALSNNHTSTIAQINNLIAGGATNIGGAMSLANSELASANTNPDALKVEILLTDGRANQPNGNGSVENPKDVALAISKSLEAANNGIVIFTVGLGSSINTAMLKSIANNTGGQYYFAPTGNDLQAIFNQIAHDMCGFKAGSPSLTIFNQKIEAVSGNSVTVSWYTNIPADSQVVYGEQSVSSLGLEPSYGYIYSTPETDTVNKTIYHVVTMGGLDPNKTYYWRPLSHGSTVLGEEMSFTINEAKASEPNIEPVVEEVAGAATETQEVTPQAANEEEALITNNAVAAVASFPTSCMIMFILLLGLTIWYIVEVMRKKKKGEKAGYILPIVIVLLALIMFFKCCNCCSFVPCWKPWIIIIINAFVFGYSMLTKKKA
jgi:cysteine-rich repeat protein